MNKDELLKGSPQQKDVLSVEDKKLINEELGLSVNEDHSGTVPESFRREFLQEIINLKKGAMDQDYKDTVSTISKELGVEFVELKVNPLTPEQMKESFSGIPTLDSDLKRVEKDETVKNISQIRESANDLDKSNHPTLK